ncbi:LamG-like jellyroll fold domain-containing protein [Haliangium sp.]|uniref:LamG-like jellyroll fold domain-containing protein n=1 Tax=Haliangium sp. TaxID=2663208 RepID=UPI003D0BC35B
MYRCPDGECPSGYECRLGQCVVEGAVIDAAQPPPPDAAVISIDGAPEPDAAPVLDPTVGNVLYLTFDGVYGPVGVVQDRGPYDLVLDNEGSFGVDGKYGRGRGFEDDDGGTDALRLPDTDRLSLGNELTIEAWVAPEEAQSQAIYGDFDGGDTPSAEYSFELLGGGGLAFHSNAGCDDFGQTAETDQASVPVGVFTHVAVTWDGADVRFYVDGVLVDTIPFAHTPCPSPGVRFWGIGRRNGGGLAFDGVIDELKVSDYAKSESEIQMSRDFDSAAAGSVCGDHVLEGAEQCDSTSACCVAATCSFEDDGSDCAGGSCQTGVCNQAGGRVNQGLVALYHFNEGSGDVVVDSSGVAPALDLDIINRVDGSLPADVTWGQGSLTINDDTVLVSSVAATKITSACQGSRELTVEAWVSPDNDVQDGPARIVTLSDDASNRSFTLGQEEQAYVLRVRTPNSDTNATPPAVTPAGDARPVFTHVVGTHGQDGMRRLYVNALLRGQSFLDGDFSPWDDTFRFAIGNELNAARPWLGTLHLVAVYCRELSDVEVARNYTAGSEP